VRAGERPDQPAHFDDLARIEAVGRLVQHHDFRLVYQRLRQRCALAVAARQHPNGLAHDLAQRQ